MHGWPARLLAVALHVTLQIEVCEFLRVEYHLLGDDLAAETVGHTHKSATVRMSFSLAFALLLEAGSYQKKKRKEKKKPLFEPKRGPKEKETTYGIQEETQRYMIPPPPIPSNHKKKIQPTNPPQAK